MRWNGGGILGLTLSMRSDSQQKQAMQSTHPFVRWRCQPLRGFLCGFFCRDVKRGQMFEAEAEVEAIFIEADHMYPLFPCDSLAGMIF